MGLVFFAFVVVATRTVRPALAQAPSATDSGREKLRHRAQYFTPRKFHNYFKGMDVISLPARGGLADAWPDQLLDHAIKRGPRPPRTLVDVVETDSEIFGRNTWMLWCGGNEAFWDWLAMNSRGVTDFLKLLDTRRRADRWRNAGMVNEPGMREALEPHEQFGLWLDVPEDPRELRYRRQFIKYAFEQIRDGRDPTVPPEGYDVSGPTTKYPATTGATRATTARANTKRGGSTYDDPVDPYDDEHPIPPAYIYGLSTGVIGLRLFPNPNFDAAAARQWDGKRYYDDPNYYRDPNLIRPFRVGMSCAFCHTSAHPLSPPLNPASPSRENLSGAIGSQYLRIRAVFGNLLTKDNFIYHVLDSQPPGTIDTSLIASDNINNTNTMNAIFGVPARVVRSFENPREHLSGATAAMPSLWPDPDKEAPPAFKDLLGAKLSDSNNRFRHVPRILLDGADSIGAYGALARVYLNIGTYHDKWIRLHEPLVGFLPPADSTDADRKNRRVQLPFTIDECEDNSVYWHATKNRVGALRDYFLKITPTMPLLDARGGGDPSARVDPKKLAHGRRVFARNCIVCHSSVQPETDPAWFLAGAQRADYLKRHADVIDRRKDAIRSWEESGELWDHDPGQWLRDPKYAAWAEEVVENEQVAPGFWRQNFLSSDFRVPVNYVGTNSGRALATNSTAGHMWEDFSSDSYRRLPSIGSVSYFNPYTRREESFSPRHVVPPGYPKAGGGPGFYRPASLMALWATAPFLHNNSLGHFNNDPSVKGRLEAFDDAIRKLFDRERRLKHSDYAEPAQLAQDHGLIWRTSEETYLQIPAKDVPQFLRRGYVPNWVLGLADRLTAMGRLRAVLPLGLLAVAFAILLVARGRRRVVRWWRYGAYGTILVALAVGFLAYLNTGGLGDLRIGPIPKGTPVNLLANINAEAPPEKIKAALRATVDGLTEISTRRLEGAERDRVYREKIAPALLEVSKCPDFVMDKGHYFPWFADMSDADKDALIELLKTF